MKRNILEGFRKRFNVLDLDAYFIVKLLVFLFPLAVVSVRHWASAIFGLLIFASLVMLPVRRKSSAILYKEEKIFLWILVGYFLVALSTILLRGWDEIGEIAMGTESRFLLITLFYLVARRCNDLWKYLSWGTFVGIIISISYGLYEYNVLGHERITGVYGPLFYGPVLLLMIVSQLPWARFYGKYNRRNILIGVVATLGLIVVFMTGARSAYVALVVCVFVAFVYYFKVRNSVLSLLVACLFFVVSYRSFDVAKERIDNGVSETKNYIAYLISHPDEANKFGETSSGTRMELWRAAIYVFAEHPYIGVGRYNFEKSIQKYAEAGLINKSAASSHGHPHNVFFEAMSSKGSLGLLVVLALYFYPLYFFIKTRNISRESAFAGILLMVSIFVFSFSQVAPVYFGNFVSVFLIFLAVIFSWHVQKVYGSSAVDKD